MPLYFLSFRDVATSSIGVLPAELYALDVDDHTDWQNVELTGANWVPWASVADVFRNKRVLFVVHGFNVSCMNGIRSCGPAAQQYEALGDLGLAVTAADIVVPVLWPGDGLIGWSWFNAYGSSDKTGANFAAFLASSAFTASSVSFVSHSLGARVVMETIVNAKKKGARVAFDTAILTAAAIGDNMLDDKTYAAASAALKRIVVLSSMNDKVLKVYFTIGSAAEQALWSNYDDTTRALGRYGPAFAAKSANPAKTEWYEIVGVSQDHGDYLPEGGEPPAGVWPDKQKDVGWFCKDTLDGHAYTAPTPPPGWGRDHTAEFRPGWTPRF
jgi:Alpha/beta hydrolase of unknown function (DUF900)